MCVIVFSKISIFWCKKNRRSFSRMCMFWMFEQPRIGSYHWLAGFVTLGRKEVSSMNSNHLQHHLGNGGTSKSSILVGFSHINHLFWGNPIYGNPHMMHLKNASPFQILDESSDHSSLTSWLGRTVPKLTKVRRTKIDGSVMTRASPSRNPMAMITRKTGYHRKETCSENHPKKKHFADLHLQPKVVYKPW